jgi:hypothetical protein
MSAGGREGAGMADQSLRVQCGNTDTTVSECGGTQAPRALRRHRPLGTTAAAPASHTVTPSIAVLPRSAGAVHIASIKASECRIPHASRESGTEAKHSSRFSSEAACSDAARDTSTSRACSAAADTGMRDWTGNGPPARRLPGLRSIYTSQTVPTRKTAWTRKTVRTLKTVITWETVLT